MVNWQQPHKQSAIGIFLFAAKAFREFIAFFIIIIGSFSRRNKPIGMWLLTLGGLALIIFGRAFLEYFYFSFYISEGQLIIKKGIFSKKTVIIPFERIQTVQLEQSLFHRIIHHYRVSIDTAGSEKTEVSIHALSYNKALSLKQALTGDVQGSGATEQAQEDVIRLSAKDLLKLAVSHNHLETFGIIIAFVLARFQDIKDFFGIDAYDWVESHGKEVAFTARMAGLAVFFALSFAIVISIVRIILRFSDLAITLSEKGFNLKYGLLHSKQQFIGASKMQYIQWNANWIRRKIGMYMFHVKTAGEDELKNKQKIQVPVTREEYLRRLAAYYQPVLPSIGNTSNRIQPHYVFRRTLIVGLPVAALFAGIPAIWMGWNALWFALWLPYFAFRNYIYYRNFHFWVNEEGIELSTGVWGRQRIVLNWHKLQVVTISQGIYQRQKFLADLQLRTASGDVVLPYVTLEEAQQLSDYAAMVAERKQKRWM